MIYTRTASGPLAEATPLNYSVHSPQVTGSPFALDQVYTYRELVIYICIDTCVGQGI